ncbi:hypothetical protein [Oceanobacter kriegii]|uniref:hypothetical protein n=1 Tax=Oceanobacter kriegii TaxID=64972 RepID=UPI000482E056|nr:hypothetical protein [Oceanobacter kriegii]
MNIPVLVLSGITSDNPFLPDAEGVDLSAAMGSVQIDFGSSDFVSSAWQKLLPTGTDYAGAAAPYGIDEVQATSSTGSLSRCLVSASESFFDTTTAEDVDSENAGYIFVSAEGGETGNPVTTVDSGDIYFKNLDPYKQYSITLLARRVPSGSLNRVGDYSINGGLTQTIDGNANSTPAEWTDISPDAEGTITLTVAKNGRSGFAYVNWVVINEQ